jgi:hypothetical protein
MATLAQLTMSHGLHLSQSHVKGSMYSIRSTMDVGTSQSLYCSMTSA